MFGSTSSFNVFRNIDSSPEGCGASSNSNSATHHGAFLQSAGNHLLYISNIAG